MKKSEELGANTSDANTDTTHSHGVIHHELWCATQNAIVHYALIVLTDLSLIEQGAIFRRIVDGVPGCILVANANGQVIYANRFAVARSGRALDELLGSGWLQSLHPTFFKNVHSQWTQCIQRSEPVDVTWLFRQHDGTYTWKHVRAEPTIREIAQSVSWYVLGVDVDDLVKAQESLSASEQEAREILDRVPAMISTRTEEGIAFTNKQLSDYIGAAITDLRDGGVPGIHTS